MDDVTIEVYVRLPDGQTLAAARRLSFYEVEEAITPIDFPTSSLSVLFATSIDQAENIIRSRKCLADEITNHIMKTIAMNDMTDGYPNK